MRRPRPPDRTTATSVWRWRLRRIREYAVRALAAVMSGLGRFPGGVDPIEGVTGGDPVVLTGWVRTGRRDCSIAVFVDGAPFALGPIARNELGPTRGTHRWTARGVLPVGDRVTVEVVAMFPRGVYQILYGRQVCTQPPRECLSPPPQRCLDSPTHGDDVLRPLVTVAGWTIDEHIQRVEVVMDGSTTAARQMATPRPDVERETGSIHAALCGFEAVIDIADRQPGDELTIHVTAVCDGDDRRPVGSIQVTVAERPSAPAVDNEQIARIRSSASRVVDSQTARPRGERGEHRLLVVTHDMGRGGGQLYLQELLLGLMRAGGVHCTVVTPTGGELSVELEAMGATVHVVGPFAIDPVGYEWTVRDLMLLGSDSGATAVLANTAGAFCGVDAAHRLQIPALWAIHESYSVDHFLEAAYGRNGIHPIVGDHFRSSLARAAAVLFEANQTRRLFEHHGDPRRFIYLPYGIPLAGIDDYAARADRSALRARYGFADGDVVLLCVGTLEQRKAQGSLVRAFAAIAADHPEAVLALVGHRGDPYGDVVERYARGLGLGDRVRVHPVTPSSYDWYSLADAFVLASDVESLPRSVLEAMAFGLPVLATDVFGLPDIIDDGVTGLLIPPRDLGALTRGLRCVVQMGCAERAALGAAGSHHVRQHNDSRGYVAAYRQLLDGLAADAHSLPAEILSRIL